MAVDIGNTNTVMGLFRDQELIHDWRIRTEVEATIDEYGIIIRSLFQASCCPMEEVKHVMSGGSARIKR